jgi:hypothetical protein
LVGAALLIAYLATLAPGVTFWDAGELVAAAYGLGIPHPPGTPLFVALGRVWIMLTGSALGVARAMNLLSALATAVAAGVTTWVVAREMGDRAGAQWGAVAAGLCVGLMTSAWANATETEVYALSTLHVALLFACASKAGEGNGARDDRWLLLCAYLIALAPAVHLSALVGVPAAIALAARTRDGRWQAPRAALLGGALLCAAGVGRVSWPLVAFGAVVVVAAALWSTDTRVVRARWLGVLPLVLLASSALFLMLVRARHDPAINQGNPSSLAALSDVVARRQYDVAAFLPRQAPLWIQLANVAQYVDWQGAMSWGTGVFTSPARVAATLVLLGLGAVGGRALRRDASRIGDALLLLTLCGTVGVAAYLNLKAGASLGWGVLPDAAPHEARERDYFFVLGFWGWGCLAGYGAFSLARARRWPPYVALAPALLLLVGNWRAVDRSREPQGTAPVVLARSLLESAPRNAVLFVSGDNDSYPLWYLQQVEGARRDVTPVTLPLLPASWYAEELARRSGLRRPTNMRVMGASWRHEETAGAIAEAARRAGRPVAASPGLTARERALLGSSWVLRGVVYVSDGAPNGEIGAVRIDTALARQWSRELPSAPRGTSFAPDDVTPTMLALLGCPRLASLPAGPSAARDSLEVTCNFR